MWVMTTICSRIAFRFFPALLLSVLIFGLNLAAQNAAAPMSPEVNKDGSIAFRMKDVGARKVEVKLQTIDKQQTLPMTKDDAGVWSVTSGVLVPDIYSYTFALDDVDIIDPGVRVQVPNYISQGGLVLVPGSPAQPWEVADVPHGEIHRHFYRSTVVGDTRDFYVYTPPGYDARKKTKYPVFYLLHGYSDYADGWTAIGKAHVILDNLIAQGKVKPMIVVMPLGYGTPEILALGWQGPKEPSAWRRNMDRFRENLLTEVMPRVESSYRVSRDRKDRAIAGLSMGGGESILTGLNNIDKFAWVGSFSGSLLAEPTESDFPAFTQAEAAKLKLLWIACGTEDELIQRNRGFKNWLKARNVTFTDLEIPQAAHTWMVWRRNLIEFSQLLFR